MKIEWQYNFHQYTAAIAEEFPCITLRHDVGVDESAAKAADMRLEFENPDQMLVFGQAIVVAAEGMIRRTMK